MSAAIDEEQVRPKARGVLDEVTVKPGEKRAEKVFVLKFLVGQVQPKPERAFPRAWREVRVPRKLFDLMAQLPQGAEYSGLVKFGTPIAGDQYLQIERPL